MTRELMSLSGVSVVYGDNVTALSNVSMCLEAGTTTAVVGRSGSGKSTLASVIGLLRTPTSGQVFIKGFEVSSLTARELSRLRADRLGFVFQSFHLEPSLSALDNVVLPWYFNPRGRSHREACESAGLVLAELGLEREKHRRPDALSGGEKQRVAIARAMFQQPELMIADEPTGNLDEGIAAEVADVLLSYAANSTRAVLLVTHDLEIARRADRVIRLSGGSVVSS